MLPLRFSCCALLPCLTSPRCPALAQRPLVFRAPTRLRVVGSFPLRATLGPDPCVDLAMAMPASCFDDKDELNHRWGRLGGWLCSARVSLAQVWVG